MLARGPAGLLEDEIDAQALRLVELQLAIRALEKKEAQYVRDLAVMQGLLVARTGGWAKHQYREVADE